MTTLPNDTAPKFRPRRRSISPALTTLLLVGATLTPTAAEAGILWGSWLDRDGPAGSGDWEDKTGHANNGDLHCDDPIDLQVRRNWGQVDALDVGEVPRYYRPETGYACRNADQADGTCYDYSVRFGCLVNPQTVVPQAGFGQAMYFDGADDRLVAMDVLPDSASSRTYELRVSPLSLKGSALLSHGGTEILGINAKGKLEATLSGGATLESTTNLEALAWTHVALRYDLSTNTTSLLVNGTIVDEALGQPAAFAGDLVIGYGTTSRYLGLLDEVRVYDVARTTDDIAQDCSLVPDATNLVLHFTFDESEGVPVNTVGVSDRAMSGDPIRVSATDRVLNMVDSSGAFEVSGDAWVGDEDFSFMAWIKADAHDGVLLQRDGYTMLMVRESGIVASVATSPAFGAGSIEWGSWQHVAFTWDQASQTAKVFLNGVEVSSRVGSSLTSTSGLLDIARDNNTSRGFDFNGKLNDVRMYGRALTETELQAEMTSVLGGDEADLIANYRLDEGDGDVAVDRTGRYDGSFLINPSWEVIIGETVLYTPSEGGTITGSLPAVGEGITYELVGTQFADAQIDPVTGQFSFTPYVPGANFDYRVTDGVTNSTPLRISAGDWAVVQLPESVALEPVMLGTFDPVVVENPGDESEFTWADPLEGEAPTIQLLNYDDPLNQYYEGGLNVLMASMETLSLEFQGDIVLDEDGRLVTMSGTAVIGGSDLPMFGDFGQTTLQVGCDYASEWNQWGLPLDQDTRYIYFTTDTNGTIEWGNHSIGNGAGATVLAVDHVDPALLIWTDSLGMYNDYISEVGLAMSYSGNLFMDPLESGINGALSQEQGEFWVKASGTIPVPDVPLGVDVSGEVMVDIMDLNNLTSDLPSLLFEGENGEDAFDLFEGMTVNGEVGMSLGAGPYTFSWGMGRGSYQYTTASDRHALAVVLGDEYLSIVPGVLEFEIPEMAYFSAVSENGELQQMYWEGTGMVLGTTYTGYMMFDEFSQQLTFDGQLQWGNVVLPATGYANENAYELISSLIVPVTFPILTNTALIIGVTINSVEGVTPDLTFSYCFPDWIPAVGGTCDTITAEVVQENDSDYACATLPLVGYTCQPL